VRIQLAAADEGVVVVRLIGLCAVTGFRRFQVRSEVDAQCVFSWRPRMKVLGRCG
jgi:hypothetical protein